MLNDAILSYQVDIFGNGRTGCDASGHLLYACCVKILTHAKFGPRHTMHLYSRLVDPHATFKCVLLAFHSQIKENPWVQWVIFIHLGLMHVQSSSCTIRCPCLNLTTSQISGVCQALPFAKMMDVTCNFDGEKSCGAAL